MKKRKRKGLLLAPDDLTVGKYIAIHSLKGVIVTEVAGPLALFGDAAVITAISLPFVVARFVVSNTVATLDVRHLNLMPVTDDFVRAQAGQPTGGQDNPVSHVDKPSV
jgi:hypothetical protein